MNALSLWARTRSATLLGALALLAAALGAPDVHADDAPAPRSVEVSITKFAFAPKDVTVAPGTRVVWTNRDQAPHTVTSNDKTFVSKGMDTDDKFDHVFTAEGDFGYICAVHPFMTGVVHVRKP